MKRLAFRLFALSAILCVGACGFSPLYGARTGQPSTETQLSLVRVGIIQNAEGQFIRNAILDRLPPTAETPRYELKVQLAETNTGINIARDATVTRQQLRTNLHAQLMDTQTQTVVWKQDMSSISGYNILGSQFTNLVSEQDARERNLNELAERLVTQVAQYFSRP